MRYEGRIFRPPSEAHSYILQATIGCSWNHCVYCDMYRDKEYRVRDLAETLADVRAAGLTLGDRVEKVFVADGDALGLSMESWLAVLPAVRAAFPRLVQVSCYATARNLLEKTEAELTALHAAGLSLVYVGPESGDDVTLKRIAKGASFDEHVDAAARTHAAGLSLSVIALLGIAGVERSALHAEATAELVTRMDPEYFAALTTTVVPGTPLLKLAQSGRFTLPTRDVMLGELRTIIDRARPRSALFRTNHASNYLPLGGRLPHDRERLLETIDLALGGALPLRAEHQRGL